VSVERGHDPRDCALVAFGGCGGLRACEIARELGIRTVLVSEQAGKERSAGRRVVRSADIRYAGQGYKLTVPWQAADPAGPIHREHQRVYGYSNPDRNIEIVTICVGARLAHVAG
jgi:N-methylhydantoinase A/oxoprolinase/acetone carboxylase beta subunit